ncbi:hypothetical protein ACUIAC_01590 [Dermabacteraceae bacterium P13138]
MQDAKNTTAALFAALPLILEEHGALSEKGLRARAELALACARSGEHESAFYQVEELLRDTLREYGEESPLSADMRAVKDDVVSAIEAAFGK